MLSRQESLLFDPFMLPRYLRLNEAIEQFTADMIAHDPKVFKSGSSDIRYVVERQLFFALFADEQLHDYFIACARQEALPDDRDLSFWIRQVAPYFRNSHPSFGEPLDRKSRILRRFYRLHGRASIQTEDCDAGRPRVLFLVIHPKFVRYLQPIAEGLAVPYAFLTIEHPEMLDTLREQNLPRVHIDLTPETLAMTLPEVEILREKFKPGFFEAWIVRLNAVRRALKVLAPNCIVVPEGNAAIYELVNQAAKAMGVPTICVQQGWAPVVHPGFRNMNYRKMLVWGQEFVDMLASYNPRQHFVATGNHVVACQPQGDVEKRPAIAFFLQNGAHWITEAAAQGMLDLILWAAEKFPDREIRVREHPGEPLPKADADRLKQAANIRLTFPGEFSLERCSLGLSGRGRDQFTTILEALATGVVPLILDVGGFGPYSPGVAERGAAIEVRNFDDARIKLEKLVNDDRYLCRVRAPSR